MGRYSQTLAYLGVPSPSWAVVSWMQTLFLQITLYKTAGGILQIRHMTASILAKPRVRKVSALACGCRISWNLFLRLFQSQASTLL